MKLIKNLKNKCVNFLSAIGNVINQNPDRKVKVTQYQAQPWEKKKSGINYKDKLEGKVSKKRKGNVNTGTTKFNHPRREMDQFR